MAEEKKLEGIANWRDVGSLVNGLTGTARVKERLLFRSARPDRASASDLTYIVDEVDLRTILDLRGKGEIKHHGRNLLDDHFATVTIKANKSHQQPPTVLSTVPPKVVSLSASQESLDSLRSSQSSDARIRYKLDFSGLSFFGMTNIFIKFIGGLLYLLGFKRTAAKLFISSTLNHVGLRGLYTNFVDRCQASLRDSLRLVGNSSNLPILVHCSQGKDRTGIVVALTLHVLGVEEDAIIEDYKLSREGLEEEIPAMLNEMKEVGMDPVFLDSPPEVMRDTLAYIRQHHGSIDAYLDHIGFGPEERATMRQALLAA